MILSQSSTKKCSAKKTSVAASYLLLVTPYLFLCMIVYQRLLITNDTGILYSWNIIYPYVGATRFHTGKRKTRVSYGDKEICLLPILLLHMLKTIFTKLNKILTSLLAEPRRTDPNNPMRLTENRASRSCLCCLRKSRISSLLNIPCILSTFITAAMQ